MEALQASLKEGRRPLARANERKPTGKRTRARTARRTAA
jgi:hypothetical protein